MKIYNIEYSKESKEDLIRIKQYIKYNLQEPETANKLISKIRKSIKIKPAPLKERVYYTNLVLTVITAL